MNGDKRYLGDAWWWLFKRDGIAQFGFFFLRWQVIQIISSMCSIDCCAQCSVSYCILSGQSDIVQLFLVAVMYKHINCTKWYMMMSSKIPKTRITPTAWGYSNYKTIHLRGGGGVLCLQNLPLKQVGYDLHVLFDTACPFYIGLLHCQELRNTF